MWTRFPPNFEEHWEGANVILRTQNANGKELHANKETLAANSSYFNAMFFSGFKEAYQDYVEVPCDYKYMLKILKTIHTKNCYFRDDLQSVDGLVEMYNIADMFDIHLIKEMCDEKREESPTSAARFAVKFGDRDTLMDILLKMDSSELLYFLNFNDSYPLFSKKDVARIYVKITNKLVVRDGADEMKKKANVVEMNSLSTEVNDRIIDLTKERYAIDLTISTRNSDGKLLYANKGVLAAFSKKFNEMFINDISSIHLDVDYVTMTSILCILHECDLELCFLTTFHPVLLYDMYRFAKEFDLPKFVSDRLLKQATAGCLEVVLKLGLQNLVSQLLATMLPSDLRDWVLSGDNDLIYNGDNGEEVTISSKFTDLNLSLNDLRLIFWKLHSKCDEESFHKRSEDLPFH